MLCLFGLTLAATAGAEDYRLGQGLAVGDNLLLSGYANVDVYAPQHGPKSLSLDDLSLFINGRISPWLNPFLEAEISEATLAQEGNAPRSGGHFVPERFYNDMRLAAADTLRIGKILSPVGDWNLVHAAPLVPTITRPLTTQRGFAEYASGISWLHESALGGSADWQLYWQPGKEWLQRPDFISPRHYRDVWGAHLNWSLGLTDKVGLSFQHGTLATTGGSYDLIGANVRKRFGRLQLEGEATASRRYDNPAQAHDREWGWYGLADYAFSSRWHGILAAEHYQDHEAVERSKYVLVGVAFKPQPAMVWKLEHVHQSGAAAEISTGWQASFSVLF